MRAPILALVWALAGSLPQQGPPRDAPAQREASAPATGAISGRVYAADTGSPIRGAIVSLAVDVSLDRTAPAVTQLAFSVDRAERGPVASTDALGRLRMTAVPAGTYRVVVMPAGYRGRYLPIGYGAVRANDAGRPIAIRAGEEVRGIDVGLPIAVAIEGRVVDENGEALSRVPVFAARLSPGSDSPQRLSQWPLFTDDLGRYRIYGLEPGTYLVGAEARHAAPAIEMTSGRGTSLSGPDPEPFVTTYHPSATADDSAQRVKLGTHDISGIDIMVQRAALLTLSGTIFDSRGIPAANTRVALVRSGLATISRSPFPTDADGRFVMGGLEAGVYRLLVGGGLWPGLTSINGRTEFAEAQVDLGAGSLEVAITTQPGIGLAGRIVFAEGPPAGRLPLKIAFRRSGGGPEMAATTDDEWRFFGSDVFGALLVRVSSLPRGWIVKAVTLRGSDITDVPTVFTRQDDGQLQIVLSSKPSTIEGEVRGDQPGKTPEATVCVFAEDRASWNASSPRTVWSDVGENGRFSVSGLAAGRYLAVAVAREGFRKPESLGVAFFELLSKEATPFVVGDDERRTLDLPLWRWPE